MSRLVGRVVARLERLVEAELRRLKCLQHDNVYGGLGHNKPQRIGITRLKSNLSSLLSSGEKMFQSEFELV